MNIKAWWGHFNYSGIGGGMTGPSLCGCGELYLFGFWIHWHYGGPNKPRLRLRGTGVNFFRQWFQFKIPLLKYYSI